MHTEHSFLKTQRVTAKDVAKKSGVSKWTVNRAFTKGASISDETRDKVLQAADELGYRPNLLARSLSKKKTNIIGVVVDQLNNPNITPVLDDITTQLQRKGFMALLLNISLESNYTSVLQLADQHQVDGLLFAGTVLSDDLITLARDTHHIALVQMFRNSINPNIQVVSTNGYRGGQEIGRLFLSQGYKKFGYVKGPDTESWELLRLDGYRDFLNSHSIQVDTILITEKYDYANGYNTIRNYLTSIPKTDYVDALFCENDIIAMGTIDAIKDHASGHHIGIVGFDDMNLSAATSYNLTTYRQPTSAIIEEAIHRLLQPNMQNQKVLLDGELICRTSHLKSTE